MTLPLDGPISGREVSLPEWVCGGCPGKYEYHDVTFNRSAAYCECGPCGGTDGCQERCCAYTDNNIHNTLSTVANNLAAEVANHIATNFPGAELVSIEWTSGNNCTGMSQRTCLLKSYSYSYRTLRAAHIQDCWT